jgi:RimJ/RimL family protein N-acetyltransferase
MQAPASDDFQHVLQTERLLLRCPRAGDGLALYQAVRESLAELRAWPEALPWALEEPSVAASEAFCLASQAEFVRRSTRVYLVFERQTLRLLGSAGLHTVGAGQPEFEIGYWCRTSAGGQGFLREAVAALLQHAFADLGARRVECLTDADNARSRRLCQRVGMVLNRTLQLPPWPPQGRVRSLSVYAATGC